MCDRIPPFLTVEEASRLLKIGRTKAYLLTQEWRATGGRSGLAVVDLGDVLRVPGPVIEQMLGIGLANTAPLPERRGGDEKGNPNPPRAHSRPIAPAVKDTKIAEEAGTVEDLAAEEVRSSASPASVRTRRPGRRSPDQLPLFEPLLPTTNPNPQTTTPTNPDPATNP